MYPNLAFLSSGVFLLLNWSVSLLFNAKALIVYIQTFIQYPGEDGQQLSSSLR